MEADLINTRKFLDTRVDEKTFETCKEKHEEQNNFRNFEKGRAFSTVS
jgi:hypothetical protein